MAERREWQASPGSFDSPEVAVAWQQVAQSRTNLDEATDLMLDFANLKPGDRVLDIAAGTGAQTLPAARRVGPNGSVLATDIAANMLAILSANANEQGLTNITTRVMDGGYLDLPDESFDAVISRLGLMFLSDLDSALIGIRRVLRPGGRLAAFVVSMSERTRLMKLPWQVLRRVGGMPTVEEVPPVPHRLGAPGLLEGAFRRAGFRDIVSQPVVYPAPAPSAAEYVKDLMTARPPFMAELASLDPAQRAQALLEIESALREHEGPGGLMMTGEVLVVAGTKQRPIRLVQPPDEHCRVLSSDEQNSLTELPDSDDRL